MLLDESFGYRLPSEILLSLGLDGGCYRIERLNVDISNEYSDGKWILDVGIHCTKLLDESRHGVNVIRYTIRGTRVTCTYEVRKFRYIRRSCLTVVVRLQLVKNGHRITDYSTN